MATDINLSQTTANCLRSIQDIGSNTVLNICTGARTVVPWGSLDWAGFWALAALMTILGLVLFGGASLLAYFAIGDWWRSHQIDKRYKESQRR